MIFTGLDRLGCTDVLTEYRFESADELGHARWRRPSAAFGRYDRRDRLGLSDDALGDGGEISEMPGDEQVQRIASKLGVDVKQAQED